MALVRSGNKTVLMVVDVQVGVMSDSWDSARVIENIQKAVEKARLHNIPVIWVQHADDELMYGSADWEWVPELVPHKDEIRIYKHYNSSFEETPLEEELAKINASLIVLAGASTNWCIRATAYGALDRGYDLTLLKDAHTTGSIELRGGNIIEARDIVTELNITMSWLSYPGRKNSAISVEELNFSDLVDRSKAYELDNLKILIRDETPGDAVAITAVTIAAFATLEVSDQTEQFVIEALRKAGALTLSLVAELDGKVVGHIAFSPVEMSDGTTDWYGLGPVSVLPEYQGKGIGKALIREGLARLKALGARGCCLVGHPEYYPQFGFENAPCLALEGAPPEVFFVLSFDGVVPQGTVTFHEGFMATGNQEHAESR